MKKQRIPPSRLHTKKVQEKPKDIQSMTAQELSLSIRADIEQVKAATGNMASEPELDSSEEDYGELETAWNEVLSIMESDTAGTM